MEPANRSVLERRSCGQGELVQWQASGVSQVADVRQQGLKMAQFGYWKKRLLAGQTPNTAPTAGFIALQRASAGATLTVVLNNSLRVEVHPGFDPVMLRAVVQALSPDVPA